MTTPSPARGRTRHVELRPLESADKDQLRAWLEPDEAEVWLASADGDPCRQGWIVELEGERVGLAGLVDIDRGHQRCAWTCHLASPDVAVAAYVHYWGFEYVFEGRRFAKLWCEVKSTDTASVSRLESLGFDIEARLRGHLIEVDGDRTDVVRLGVLAGDWRRKRGAMAARLRAFGFEPPLIG